MNTQKNPTATPDLDAIADGDGKTHRITPESKKRLLELKGELERSTGEQRVRLQAEIDKLKSV